MNASWLRYGAITAILCASFLIIRRGSPLPSVADRPEALQSKQAHPSIQRPSDNSKTAGHDSTTDSQEVAVGEHQNELAARAILEEAAENTATGDYAAAIMKLDLLLELSKPTRTTDVATEAHVRRAGAYLWAGYVRLARGDLDAAARLDPSIDIRSLQVIAACLDLNESKRNLIDLAGKLDRLLDEQADRLSEDSKNLALNAVILLASRLDAKLYEEYAKSYEPWPELDEFRRLGERLLASQQGGPLCARSLGPRQSVRLPVTIGFCDYLFLIDTGAGMSMIHSALAKRFLSSPYQRTVDSWSVVTSGTVTESLSCLHSPELFIGRQLRSDSPWLLAKDLDPLSLTVGARLAGVLGLDHLAKFCLVVDYDRGIVEFHSDKAPNEAWDFELDLKPTPGGVLTVTANVDGQPVDLIVDTGCESTGAVDFPTAPNETEGDDVWPPWRTFAGLQIGDMSLGAYWGKADGLPVLGNGFLSRFRVCFDFPRRKLLLKRGRCFHATDPSDFYGLRFRRGERLVVSAVRDGSPASRAGIRVGDKLKSLNEDPFSGSNRLLEWMRLYRSLGELGAKTLVFERDGAVRVSALP